MEINCECKATKPTSKRCKICKGFGVIDVKPGMTVTYVPDHAHKLGIPDYSHPSVEWGFVTSVNDEFVFCRYFMSHNNMQLRTKANSEATMPRNLYYASTGKAGQLIADTWLKELGYERDETHS